MSRLPSLQAAFKELAPTAGAGEVLLLSDNATAWATRWQLLSEATQRIDTTTFILAHDVFGVAFLGALYEATQRGVHVRLLVDGRGSSAWSFPLLGRDVLQELVATGHAEVHVFNPPLSQLLRSLTEVSMIPVSSSTHNKILVIDDRVALTGGRNIGSNYFVRFDENPGAVVDTDVLVFGGSLVKQVSQTMDEEFGLWPVDDVQADLVNIIRKDRELLMVRAAMDAWVRGQVPASPAEVARAELENVAVRALGQGASELSAEERAHLGAHLAQLVSAQSVYQALPQPTSRRHAVQAQVVRASSRLQHVDESANLALMQAAAGAQKSIVLQTPYFLPSKRLLQTLTLAGRRGVKITILTNSPVSTDNPSSQALFIDSWPELLARIPNSRLFVGATPQMLHVKRAVFDDQLTFVGSYNIDPFSAHMNSELMLAVWSEAFNAESRAEIDARRHSPAVLEYRIVRDARGVARRYPKGSARAGQVVVDFGPRDHVPQARIDELVALKEFLIGTRGFWDFEVLVW